MGKVGRWVTDPKTGTHCTITLDSGEKILVNHDKGGSRGGSLTIERLKLLGFSSDRVFTCDLESPEGQRVLTFLTRGAQAGSLDATPLGAFVKYFQTSASVAEVQARCVALMAAPHRPDR